MKPTRGYLTWRASWNSSFVWLNAILIFETENGGVSALNLLENFSPIWRLNIQWTGLLVVVKLHVLVQSLKNVIVKKFNRPIVLWCELLPESLPRSSQSLWSRRSSSTCPLDPALAPHTFKVTHCSSDLRKTFLTNRTSCLGDFFASIQTQASQKTHRASTGLVDISPW